MFTVAELVDQGYTEKHARQFLQRERVQHNNGKATLKARRADRTIAITPVSPIATEVKVISLKDRMIAVQNKSTSRIPGSNRSETERRNSIREWAKTQGHKVSPFGKIPDSIVEEYEHANGRKSGQASS